MERSNIGYLLNSAARQLRLDLGEALAPTGLRPQQAAAIIAISKSKDSRLTPSGLACAIGTDAATTSGLLQRLTRDSWIRPELNPSDRRSRLFVLTEKAHKVLPSVIATADAVSADATRCLTTEELATLAELLHRVCSQGGAKGAEVGAP